MFKIPTKLLILFSLGAFFLISCSAFATPTPTVVVPTQQPGSSIGGSVSAEGRLVPKEHAELTFPISGQVEEVLVKKGDEVKKGDVVARLSNAEQMHAAIANAELELTNSKQALDDLDKNAATEKANYMQEISKQSQAVRDAQFNLDNFKIRKGQETMTPMEGIKMTSQALDKARAAYEPYKFKCDAGTGNKNNINLSECNKTKNKLKQELDWAQSDYNSAVHRLELATALETAQARLDKAMQDLETVKDGPDPEKVASAEARIAAAEASLESAKSNLQDLDLLATIDGTVVEVDIIPGDQVAPGKIVAQLADFSEWYVETDNLTEIDVVNIENDQRVRVVADAIPDLELAGVVERIAQTYEEKRGDITYTTKILLKESDPRLRWGMTVLVTFLSE